MPIYAPADEVFAFLSEVRNLPHYLPPITHAEPEEGDRVWLGGRNPEGETFEGDGYYRWTRPPGGWSGARTRRGPTRGG
jgi:hypothetical protein